MTNDRALVVEVSQMDNAVDRLDEAIKLYVAKLTSSSLDEREGRRAMEIVSFSINLEHVGDIIDKNLSELADKKAKRKLQFSAEGAAELDGVPPAHPATTCRIAFGVFMSGNVEDARKLIARKERNCAAPKSPPAERHFERLREARPRRLETTSHPSRRAARPQAHPLAHLLGGLSGAGGRGRNGRGRCDRERSGDARSVGRQAAAR